MIGPAPVTYLSLAPQNLRHYGAVTCAIIIIIIIIITYSSSNKRINYRNCQDCAIIMYSLILLRSSLYVCTEVLINA